MFLMFELSIVLDNSAVYCFFLSFY